MCSNRFYSLAENQYNADLFSKNVQYCLALIKNRFKGRGDPGSKKSLPYMKVQPVMESLL